MRAPSYRRQRLRGRADQAFVELSRGNRVWLGTYDSPESKAQYRRVIMEWRASHGAAVQSRAARFDATVTELIVAYVKHAEVYYRKNGEPTSELDSIKTALRDLRLQYGDIPAGQFTAGKLHAMQSWWTESTRGHRKDGTPKKLTRSGVNRFVRIVKRAFKWAAGPPGIVDASVYGALTVLPDLKRGRTLAVETEPVAPAPDAAIDAILEFLPPPVRAMIQVQRHSSCRPHEACDMKPRHIDTSGEIWAYTPPRHKTEHHGKTTVRMLGKRCQEQLRALWPDDDDEYFFRPCDAVRWRYVREKNEQERKKPARLVLNDKYQPCYNTRSYRQAIRRACERANVAPFSPMQIRHTYATEVRKVAGLDKARASMGHAGADTTEIYAERDRAVAIDIAKQVG